jgi:flagellar hook-length control protein FliK
MRLIIYPEQLGEVKLHVGTREGKVEVKITTENEDVAKVIRGGSRELETSLRDQNLSLTKFDVSVADGGVASLDNSKGSLSDQFLQQQNPQNNFSGMFGRDDSQSSRWENQSGQGNTRDNSSGFMAQENESKRSSSFSKQTTRAKDSSRKLDVVA